MTTFPIYLTQYPNMNGTFPVHISLNRLPGGYPAHRHDFLEFSYVLEGSGAEAVNGIRHRMVPGAFTFVLPYQVHELFTDPDSSLLLYNCRFSMDLLLESATDKETWFSLMLADEAGLPPYVQFEGAAHERMKLLLEEIFEEFNGEAFGRTPLLKAKLTEVLVRFDRLRRQDGPEHLSTVMYGKADRQVWPIIQYIRTHYQNPDLMLSELSEQFVMSASRISEVIKETTGQTFLQFLTDLRLRYASSLLMSTDMSVLDIACEAGFGSYKTFVRLFRERKGMAPTDYRKGKPVASSIVP